MVRATRSKASTTSKSTPTDSTTPAPISQSTFTLPDQSSNPPRIFILPSKATAEARIVSLLCPRTAKPARYLVCPESGIYEFTRVAAPKSAPKSWLVESTGADGIATIRDGRDATSASITRGADLYVATPIDPLFLVLPAVAATSHAKSDEKKLFLSGEDHFDSIAEISPHLSEMLRWADGKVQALLESRMASICDTVEAGDEVMFRFSEEKLLAELFEKARSLSAQPLPKSMEEKFVTKALEAPMVGVKVREVVTNLTKIGPNSDTVKENNLTSESVPEGHSSVSSAGVAQSSASDAPPASTGATPLANTSSEPAEAEDVVGSIAVSGMSPAIQASDDIVALQRLRIAFSYICSAYLSPARAASVKRLLASRSREVGPSAVHFAPLDEYLSKIAKMRDDAAAARSMGDYSRKRVLDDDEAAERAEKKRLKEEEDRRKKAGESRGVKNLKKVNTTGMMKMSAFFKKKA